MPWWSDLKLPGSEEVFQFIWDLENDEKFFPATKAQILKSAPSSQEDAEFLNQSLPEQTYKNTGDVVAPLISHMPPIESGKEPLGILWKYPAAAISPGQRLIVGEGQIAMMASKSGKACDEFAPGSYVISSSVCPLLAQESRKVAPGYNYGILNGSPVFFSPSFEFEIDLTTFGQTRALRRVALKGFARVRVQTPKKFIDLMGAKNSLSSQQALSTLTKYCSETVRKEMSAHELGDFSGNNQIIEKPLIEALNEAGMEPVKISLDYVGELGPGMFIPSQNQGKNDPRSAEQMRQMAESMKASQTKRMQEIQQMMQQQQSFRGSQSIICPNCNSPNSHASKFCNNCGTPLPVPAKKACPSCGKLSDSEVKFCGNCGTKL